MPNSVESLIQSLENNDPDVRYKIVIDLAYNKKVIAVDVFIYALNNCNYSDTRLDIATVINAGLVKSIKFIDPLIEALADSHAGVRSFAASALGNYKSNKSIEPLVYSTLTDADDDVRLEASLSLAKLKSDEAVDLLLKALNSSNWKEIRNNAAKALGIISSEKAINSLILALNDKDSDVRGSSAVALGTVETECAIDPLIQALNDEKKTVRIKAIGALERINSEKAIVFLRRVASDDLDADVRESAQKAIAEIQKN